MVEQHNHGSLTVDEPPVRESRPSAAGHAGKTTVLRIAFVTSVHPDFDARVWKYCLMLARRGHEIHLVCPWRARDGEMRDGVTLHTFPRVRSRVSNPFAVPWRLGRKLRRLLPSVDLVHFHDIDILPWMAGLALFKPVVYDVHENYPEEVLVRHWAQRIPGPAGRLLSRSIRIGQAALSRVIRNVIFVVAEQECDFPVSALHSHHVRNYASLELLEQVNPDYLSRAPAVVFIGSNYEANGTFLFLEIAARMRIQHPGLRFIMTERWANAETRNRTLATIAERGLTNVSIVPKFLPQRVMECLNIATIGMSADLRVPQRARALPTKLFEYMAAGLPIVASDLPNSVSVARETGALILCRPEEPDTFVQAITRLLNDRGSARETGLRGQRAFIERFCWESQAPALETFYLRILGAEAGFPKSADQPFTG